MLVADQETFNPCFNELIDSILNVLPIPAVIFDHTFIDRQTSGHLEVEDGFSLFIREKAVLHELRNKVFFGKLTELVRSRTEAVSSENRIRNSWLSCTFRQKG